VCLVGIMSSSQLEALCFQLGRELIVANATTGRLFAMNMVKVVELQRNPHQNRKMFPFCDL
jgi:hypothetical protein